MIDIVKENIKEINRFINWLRPVNKKISGIVPITADKNIFLILVILFNNKLVPNKIT